MNDLLADRATREIIGTLGDAPEQSFDAPQIAGAIDVAVSGRLVRDRLRVLERGALVVATSRAASDGSEPTRWALTESGRDLHRLLSLITRITTHAARLPDAAPSSAVDPVVGCALSTLADHAVVGVLRALVAVPELDPLALEAACPFVPRRTLYRRLGPLVDAGVVIRETTRQVPRKTRYSFADRWRPAVAILVLIAWWEGRHPIPGGPPTVIDFEGVVTAIGPAVRLRRTTSAEVRLRLAVDDHRFDVIAARTVRCAPVDPAAGPAATISGSTRAWMGALVEGQRQELAVTGDAAEAEQLVAGLRAALLAYVR